MGGNKSRSLLDEYGRDEEEGREMTSRNGRRGRTATQSGDRFNHGTSKKENKMKWKKSEEEEDEMKSDNNGQNKATARHGA